jgi:hydroxysqualene synthase
MTAAASKMVATPARVLDDPELSSHLWALEDSYTYCERLARSHYENFPVGSVLIRKDLRRYFYAIYAFARIADDFADEGYDGGGYSESERLGWLSRWGQQLKEAYDGQATHPVFVALADTAARHSLPIELFEDLISAFSQDVVVRRYETFADVVDYCRRSANPIGRLILLLFGYRDPVLHSRSDDICTGLQLANHWQDIAIDLKKDRVYLPNEDLQRFGLTVEAIRTEGASGNFKDLVAFETSRARDLFINGKPLCTQVSGRLSLELRVVWLGGMMILRRIEENDFDVFGNRPSIGFADKLTILIRAASKRAFNSYQR